MPTQDAIAVIEAELGVPVTSVFRGIEPSTSPIAAASLGQVYRVQLAEEDQVVAVKVQVRSLTLPPVAAYSE